MKNLKIIITAFFIFGAILIIFLLKNDTHSMSKSDYIHQKYFLASIDIFKKWDKKKAAIFSSNTYSYEEKNKLMEFEGNKAFVETDMLQEKLREEEKNLYPGQFEQVKYLKRFMNEQKKYISLTKDLRYESQNFKQWDMRLKMCEDELENNARGYHIARNEKSE